MEMKVYDSRGLEYSIWTVPAPYCAVQYINDLRYLGEGKIGRKTQELKATKRNATLRALRAMSGKNSGQQELLQVATLKNIKAREEYFWNFSEKLMFKRVNSTHLLKKVEREQRTQSKVPANNQDAVV